MVGNVECLILAAGKGSRLSHRGEPKAAVPLLGRPIIEWVVAAAHGVGMNRFHVVTGYRSENLIPVLLGCAEKLGVSIHPILNTRWEQGSAVSFLSARAQIKGTFLLLRRLFQEGIRGDEVRLAVDFRIRENPFVDDGDATKVLARGDRIENIGKSISPYNAYDTGIFLCSPILFEKVDRALPGSDQTLSGGVKELASEGKARILDIRDDRWVDVDDEKAYGAAVDLISGAGGYRDAGRGF